MKEYWVRICSFALAFLLCLQPVTVTALEDIVEIIADTEAFREDEEMPTDNLTAIDAVSGTLTDDTEPVDDCFELEDGIETVLDEPAELLVMRPSTAAGIQRAADIECWIIAPVFHQNRDLLLLETPLGVNCLPETVPAKLFQVALYEENPFSYAGEIINAEYVVNYVTDGSGKILDNEFDFSAPDLYTVNATIVIPPGYTKSTDRSYKSSLSFYFIITVTVPEPDWHFSTYKVSNAYAEAGSSPDTWNLQDSVVCSIRDRNYSKPDVELGALPITWDLSNIVIDAPGVDVNGEYEATVYGVITIPGSIDITGVNGISSNRTVPAEAYVIVRRAEAFLGFSKPTKYITNPDFKDAGNDPYVSFAVNFIEGNWGRDFSIWMTDDNGKTFTDVNGSEDVVIYAGGRREYVVSYVDFYNLECNKWYGVCLELKGDYTYAGTTETIYFMYTEEDVYTEPSGGDRNSDGRWPFISNGNNEPENNANVNNDNSNGNNSSNDDFNTTNQSGNDSSASSSLSSSGSRSVSAPFSFGDSTGSVTGKRLDALMTVYPENVPFVSNGSQLQISTDFIKSLELSQSGTLSASVSKVTKNSFSIQLKVNGKAMDYTGQKPYTARITYTPANGVNTSNLLIVDSGGNIQPVSYYDSRGYFILKTNQFDDFSIVEGKPVSYSDFKNGYLDFLSSRGIITGTSGQKFNPSIAARHSDLYKILENLSGGIEDAASRTYSQTALIYSAAVGLLEKYAKQAGVAVDRKELLSVLSINENTVLSRYGCIKLATEFIKKL